MVNSIPSECSAAYSVHVQFETIHPYLDGNGSLGRMLIALLMDHWQLLKSLLLYLSLYFLQLLE